MQTSTFLTPLALAAFVASCTLGGCQPQGEDGPSGEGGAGGEFTDDGGRAGSDSPIGGGGGAAGGGQAGSSQAGSGAGGQAGASQGGAAGGGQAGSQGGKGGAAGAAPVRVDFGIDSLPDNTTCIAIATATDTIPPKLSDTGCVQKQNPREPATGVIPYDVASPLWSDGASKRRFMALPAGGKIKVQADGDWELPIGTTLIKTFELDGQMLETRFMVRLKDGSWLGYTYQWPPNGTDAMLQDKDAADRKVGNIRWTFPSRANCLACHTEAAGRSLGLETAQLNSDFVYSGNKVANQLATFTHLALFTAPIGDPAKLPALPNPLTSTTATTEARARSYLHSNCSHCHRPGGAMEVSLDLRYATTLAQTKTCNVVPSKTTYNIPGAMLIAPGSAGPDSQSIVSVRLNSTIANIRMPALGTSVLNTQAVALIDAWITKLKACP
ncbi:MAG: hypothetical protein SF187_01650 [Deltaproteobacteria bacterium]|nr:hypothetical protein [Deltaproteobacteria bacterium]